MNSSFRFRKKTDYGLVMMALLAQKGKGELMSVREMQELGLPRSFLVKIAKSLIDAKVVAAKEGRGGGYYLNKDPKTISLRKVVEALEGKVATASCVHGIKCPMYDKCPHRILMSVISKELSDVLERHTVADLARGQ